MAKILESCEEGVHYNECICNAGEDNEDKKTSNACNKNMTCINVLPNLWNYHYYYLTA